MVLTAFQLSLAQTLQTKQNSRPIFFVGDFFLWISDPLRIKNMQLTQCETDIQSLFLDFKTPLWNLKYARNCFRASAPVREGTVFVALTSKMYTQQTRWHREMKGSTTVRWTASSFDWPSTAFWRPDSWAINCSEGETREIILSVMRYRNTRWGRSSLYRPFSCRRARIVLWSGLQGAMEQTGPRSWEGESTNTFSITYTGKSNMCCNILPSKGLPIYELQHMTSDVKHRLPVPFQHPLGKQPGWNMTDSAWVQFYQQLYHYLSLKRQLASIRTPPKTCEAL